MKNILTKVFMMILIGGASPYGYSCITEPWYDITSKPVERMNYADIVFYGKLIEFNDFTDYEQIVTFEVLDTYKGPELKAVTITNYLNSSCSRVITSKGSAYYIYATLDEHRSIYVMDGGATFVPDTIAKEKELRKKLETAHNKSLKNN